MVFDAHARGFAFFGGVPLRGIYDNMKTAVAAVFVGKERVFSRRFLVMADHCMVEPTACTPAAGWEKLYEKTSGLITTNPAFGEWPARLWGLPRQARRLRCSAIPR
jgi:hypothetical protein